MTSHLYWSSMKTVSASEFKTKCLAMLDEIDRSGETVVITKRGRPVARLSPAAQGTSRYPQSDLAGSVDILGDVIEPPLSSAAWEAETSSENPA